MKQGAATLMLLLIISGASLADHHDPCGSEVPTEVILVVREDELLAFSGLTGRWISLDFKVGERLIQKKAGGNVAAAFTDRRALCFSALTGLWAAEELEVGERLEAIELEGNVAAVLTNKRVLGFSARTGMWVAERLTISDQPSRLR